MADITAEKANIAHDEEMNAVEGLTPEEKVIERKLRRRIDSIIMPIVILVYLMNYIDRNNYAAAKLQGLEEDLSLNDQQYQTGLSILFVGYILMQVPSNLLLNYMGRPSLYLGGCTVAWGLVSAVTSQVTNYGGIVACRFILGLVEAPFFAGVLFYLSKWYTKNELALRMSIFYSGSLLSGAFGNLIAAGILDGMAGARGLSPWQWLYIIEGAITVFIGLAVCVLLPDFPENWRRLPEEMRHVAKKRLAIEARQADVDAGTGMSQMQGLKLAFQDPKTYALAIAYMAITGASGFQNFFPSLTATLGYNRTISLLLVAPPYIFMVFYSMAHSYMSDRFGKRFWFFIYPIPITIVGFVIFMSTEVFGARYFSFFLMVFVFAQNGTVYSWIAGAIPRPPAKRAAAYAFINSIGNSASIWTPYTYREADIPYYRPAMGVCIALQVIGALMAVFMYFHLTSLNKRQERFEDESAILTEKDQKVLQQIAEQEGIDIAAARQHQRGFRYVI
ncbi:major facilitator superfamily domain-containing protein [Aspergillus granulosus]|uniref:Major facilitator superfamily domain-containing protein n=1 Tax=Aspergillus granulosus TaxID=176169 RepID=A0ABR4HLZ2_9EURO